MKKSLLLTLALAILAFSGSFAKEVTKEDARKAAINAYFEKVNQYDDGISFSDVVVTYDYTRYSDGTAAFYAFDFSSGGFMIIAAEDALNPIIGYSFEGEFPKGEHAYVYSSFIQGYVDQVNYIRENNIEADATTINAWKYYLTNEVSGLNTFRDPKDVDPLVTSMWNQDSPYNLMCPEDPSGPNGHVYVGCVATAMSQIMHYYSYPTNGTGDHCYTPGNPVYGQQCADFENTYYRWTGMMDNINNYNPMPIAEIGYHCAVGVNMNFSPSGSGSFSYIVPNRLNAFFRYSGTQHLEKGNYTPSGWNDILTGEIDLDRPLYYSGQSTTGGHAFVCDGYQGTDYHFNFGWSGYGNGYYPLIGSNGVNGYYMQQACVRYFYPSDPNYPYHNTGDIVITEYSGQFMDGSGPLDDYLPNNEASWLIDPQTAEDSITDVTLYFVSFDLESGDYLRIYDGGDASAPLIGEYTGNTLPDLHTSTGNQLFITLSTDGSGEASGFKAEFYSGFPDYCTGLVTLTDPVGTISDGSNDFNYAPGTTCMFRIQPPNAGEITIQFNYFETEEDKDIVQIYDGNTQVGAFSGNDIPGPFTCTGEFVFVTFSSNTTNHYPGWELSYEIDNVGVEEKETFAQLDVFPNPATNGLNVNFKLEQVQTVEMRLVNVTGEAVYSNVLTNVNGTVNNNIDVSTFAKGIYILNLRSAEGTVNKKVIVK